MIDAFFLFLSFSWILWKWESLPLKTKIFDNISCFPFLFDVGRDFFDNYTAVEESNNFFSPITASFLMNSTLSYWLRDMDYLSCFSVCIPFLL